MHAPFLAFLLAFLASPASAQSPTTLAYDTRATPLDELSRELLLETGYVIRDDGKIWDNIADNAVRHDEMSYLLARLAGARRLKALLELNLILNRSKGEKKLTAEERERVRGILRKHWAVFGVGTRKDFRAYFSVKELTEELDRIPPRFDRGSALLMRDPDPNTAPSRTLAAAPISVTAPPPAQTYAPVPVPPAEPAPEPPAAAAPRQFIPRSVLTPFLAPPSLRRPSPFAPRARPEAEAPVAAAPAAPVPAPAPYADPAMPAAIAAVLGAMAPVDGPRPAAKAPAPAAAAPPRPSPAPVAYAPAPPAVSAPPPPLTPVHVPVTSAPSAPPAPPAAAVARAPAPIPIPMPAAAPPTTALFGSVPPAQPSGSGDLGQLKPWTPEAAPESAKPAPAPAAPAPVPAPVEAPKVRQDATQAEFDAFVANGPYSREGQALLKLLAEKAPEFCRAILRRTVVRGAPLIVFDGARAGSDRRAGFAVPDPSHRAVTIALSAGPLLVERRKGLFKKTLVALPEDPRAWAELGVAPPALDALKKGSAPVAQENGPWGVARVYADGSRHGTYSPQEQAGELLERLLLLGLEREGFAASTYAARVWARSARLLFSARLAEDHGTDSFLDPDRRMELKEWIERGDESADLLVASWSSSRGNVLDPRRGGPESQSRYERQARESCTRSLLADHLAEAARDLAARVRTLEALVEAGLLSGADAKAAATKAANREEAARSALLASPPACDGRFGADEHGLRLSSALLAEVSRAERAFRERKPGGSDE